MAYTTKNDKIYNSWRKMHIRCYDTTYHSYHRYGSRGITVCAEWHKYETFKADLQEGWFEGATLDRIDVNKGYSPENCRWLTQAENKKSLKYTTKEILDLYESGLNQYQLAELYGTTQPYISRLLRRERGKTAI